MRTLEWKRLPVGWVNPESMSDLKWIQGKGSANSAALMIFIALGVYASPVDDPVAELEAGEASPTYEELQKFCGLSRALISKGIGKLVELNRIEKKKKGVRTVYKINGLTDILKLQKWGKIPFKYFTKKGEVRSVFQNMSVRRKSTLHALKIYLMAIKFRDNNNNYARFSYDKIQEFASIPKFEIKAALQILTENKLLIIDLVPAINNEYRQNVYRVYGVGNTTHLATLPTHEFESLVNS